VTGPQNLQLASCQVDLARRLVDRDGEELRLSTREAELLSYLAARAGQDIPRDDLYRDVWGYAKGTRSRTLDNTIARLRRKIEGRPKRPQHLLTLAGIGYRLELAAEGELLPSREPAGLIGREHELSELAALLGRGVRLVSLIGPPGIGKTALAQHLATLHPGLHPLDEASAEEVGGARIARPDSTLVVTGRRPLRLQGERRFLVPPLPAEAALSLLVGALDAPPPSPKQRQRLGQAVASLEGNPQLIVELARTLAARTESGRWSASLRFVQLPQWLETHILSWKGTFRASLEDDWAELRPAAQALLRWAAEAEGGFSLDDLSEATASGLDPHESVDLLQDLCEGSALVGEAGGRFRVPLPMRTYVLARKAETAAETTRS